MPLSKYLHSEVAVGRVLTRGKLLEINGVSSTMQ